MKKIKLILIGGFLGSGKTTLLATLAKKMAKEGKKVGLITNDQAPGLVDTQFLKQQSIKVEEVAGSCFCCNFEGLINAASRLKNRLNVDVLIAEPVGSCTDLSATILQPLKANYHNKFEVAPLSVLADPFTLKYLMETKPRMLHPNIVYIYFKQLEEADCILINKVDVLKNEHVNYLRQLLIKKFPDYPIHLISASKDNGIDQWLEDMELVREPGNRILDIDYDLYAEGEALLGWFNGAYTVSQKEPGSWKHTVRDLLRSIQDELIRKKICLGHLKIIASNKQSSVIGNLTATDSEVHIRGKSFSSEKIEMVLNIRAEIDPGALENLITKTMQKFCLNKFDFQVQASQSLSPARPKPNYRYQEVVQVE